MSSTRRDDLLAALSNAEENGGELTEDFVPPSAEPEVESVEQQATSETAERQRDESGRFAPKQAAAKVETAQVEQPVEQIAAQRTDAPKSWKQEYKAQWDKLDPQVAGYISQREQEMQRGVDEYRQKAEPALSLYQEVAPYVQEAQQRGFSMQQFVSDAKDLFYTRDVLMKSDPQTKLQTIVNIAHAAGVPLAQMLQGQVSPEQQQAINPQVMALQQRLQALEGNLTQREEMERKRSQEATNSEIAAFASNKEAHPHFDVLRETMAGLIQSGMADSLDSAYSKALRLHDDLFQADQARQREASDLGRRQAADKAAKAAKANAVSMRGTTPGAVAATGVAPKGRREALSAAFEGVQTGRI